MTAVLRAFFGYLFLVLIIRIVGRRPGKQLTPFEYVLIFFIGGLTLTTLIGDDRSVTNGVCIVITVGLTHLLLAWLKQHSSLVGRLIDGTPLVLLSQGEFRSTVMLKVGIADDDIMAAARDKGLKTLDQIQYAVLERNGEISILEKKH